MLEAKVRDEITTLKGNIHKQDFLPLNFKNKLKKILTVNKQNILEDIRQSV